MVVKHPISCGSSARSAVWFATKPAGRAAAGFTLIELLITIVILTILLVMAAPSFRDTIDRRRVTNAGIELKDQLQQARSLSVLLNRPVAVEFKFTSATEWCFGITDRLSCDCTAAVGPTDAGSCSFSKPDDLTDRVMAVTTSASYPGVGLAEAALGTGQLIAFEPTRGVRADGPPTNTVTYNLNSLQTGRNIRVSVNRIGRTAMCSTTQAMIGGINAC